MNILLLGSGGREHALAWKLAQSPRVDTLYAAPGNPGIAQSARIVSLDATDHGAVAAFCADKAINLVVVGPEAPLVDGLIPAANLPSYVDDVLEYAGTANFPATGESGKIYVDINASLCYRWTGTQYVAVSSTGSSGGVSLGLVIALS